MSKTNAILALSLVFPLLALSNEAGATPLASSAIVGITEPAFLPARATLGRHKVLPEKKRIHVKRKAKY